MMNETFSAALAAMGLAVIFIYFILASQFASFVQPVAIMASLPLSFVGAFIALLVTGTTLNMLSMIGMIMLMGLVTKNAILLIDFTNHGLRAGKLLREALLDAGVDDFGIGLMLRQRQVKKMVASYVGENAEFERQLLSGELLVELIPQGTLATRCLAAGYGMPAVYTPAGVGTEVAQGKEVRTFHGKPYLLELAFDADFAIVKAWKGDTKGNLVYRATARNFNPVMAMAGRITIAEVEHLVPAGELDPDAIHTPGIYVHRIFQGTAYEKRIEQRTVRERKR